MNPKYGQILLFCALLFSWNCGRADFFHPPIQKGNLDLRNGELAGDSIPLQGEWEIYPGKFLDSEPGNPEVKEPLYVWSPGTWNDFKKDGQILFPRGRGFATYRLNLILPANSPDLMLRIPDQGSSYAVYANGKLLEKVGKIGKTAEEAVPFLGSSIIVLPTDTKQLDFEISNFKHAQGGLWFSPRLGEAHTILKEHHIDLALEIGTSSSVLVLAIYQIVAFLRFRKERGPMYFAIFCGAGVLRFFLTGDRLFNSAFPEIPFEITYRLEYLSTYALCAGFLSYSVTSFPKDFHPKTELASFISFLLFGFTAIFLPLWTFPILLVPFQILVAVGGIFILIGCARAALHKRPGSRLFLLGIFFILLAATNDILASQYIIYNRYILAPALFLFIFLHSLSFALSFSKALEASRKTGGELQTANEDLNELKIALEGKVESRTKQLTIAKEKAEFEAKYRHDFLATMSHEIRTPLNGLLGTANLLSESPLGAEQKEYVDIIQISGENLLHLVNQLLDLSKIDNHRFSLEIIPFDPFAVLQKAAKVVKARAEEKRIIVNILYPEHHPGIYSGDEGRIQQVLLNLLSNSVKFTSSGGRISIGVRFYGEDTISRILEFWVEDDGVGISQDKAAALFEPFVQADSSVARKFGGSGLGLTISKKLVELMGGSIRLKSEFGKGSKFSFLLPFPQEETDKQDLEDENISRPVFPSAKILVVEDQDFSRKIAKDMLVNLGMYVDAVANGKDALSALEKETYHIILLDNDLPEISGTELAQRIKETQKDCPFLVAWTAHALPGSEESFRDAGFDDYIKKPSLQKDWENFLESYFHSHPQIS